MFSFLKRKPQIKGDIGFYGLEEWWLNELSEEDRQSMQERFKPFGPSTNALISGNIMSNSQSVVSFLSVLSGWFSKSEDRHIAYKILRKAKTLLNAHTDVLDIHFLYQSMIQIYYMDRASAEAIENAIDACRLQISIAPEVSKAFRKEYPHWPNLQLHKGFEQLAIILEKQHRFDEAIQLCEQARTAGWAGDWEKRIQRCQKQLRGI